MSRPITFTPEEAQLLGALLMDQLAKDAKLSPPADQRMVWRLMVKLDRGLHEQDGLGDIWGGLPMWVRQILHTTYAPDQAPKKKPAPKAAARGAVSSAAKGSTGRKVSPHAPTKAVPPVTPRPGRTPKPLPVAGLPGKPRPEDLG